MTPSQWLFTFLILSTALNAGTAIAYWYFTRHGLALVFMCYAVSNLGLMYDAMK